MSKSVMRTVVSVSVIHEDKLLLIQEGRRKKRGCWNLPSGRVERGEPLTNAALREAEEESGYKVKLLGLVGVYTYISPSENYVLRFVFSGEIVGGEARGNGNEIIDVAWFPLDEVRAMSDENLWAPNLLRTIISDATTGPHAPVSIVREFTSTKLNL